MKKEQLQTIDDEQISIEDTALDRRQSQVDWRATTKPRKALRGSFKTSF